MGIKILKEILIWIGAMLVTAVGAFSLGAVMAAYGCGRRME